MKNQKNNLNNTKRNVAVAAFLLACTNATGAWAQGVMLSEPAPEGTLPPEVTPIDPSSMPQNSAALNGAVNATNMNAQNAGFVPPRNIAAQQMQPPGYAQNMPQAQNMSASPLMMPGQGMVSQQMQPLTGAVNYQQPRQSYANRATVANTINTLTRLAGPALMIGSLASRRPSTSYRMGMLGLGMSGMGFGGFRF